MWRSQPRVREALGWATGHERGYTACLGTGFGGRRTSTLYLNDPDNRIWQLQVTYLPGTWSLYTSARAPVTFVGCG